MTKKTLKVSRNEVNLYTLQCSCKYYRTMAKLFPNRDIRRICSHIYMKITNEGDQYFDEITKLLIHAKFWFGQEILTYSLINNTSMYVGLNKNFSRVIVHLLEDNWKRYIFDFIEETWFDNKIPYNHYQIINNVVKIINYYKSN
ncbi:MAG: hypothetical protein IPM32_15445 [Ignavibacteriae bacterium]|nr:hypothetical protein [Ignavibacteriota bacterium]